MASCQLSIRSNIFSLTRKSGYTKHHRYHKSKLNAFFPLKEQQVRRIPSYLLLYNLYHLTRNSLLGHIRMTNVPTILDDGLQELRHRYTRQPVSKLNSANIMSAYDRDARNLLLGQEAELWGSYFQGASLFL